jgi:hypothetical protein
MVTFGQKTPNLHSCPAKVSKGVSLGARWSIIGNRKSTEIQKLAEQKLFVIMKGNFFALAIKWIQEN